MNNVIEFYDKEILYANFIFYESFGLRRFATGTHSQRPLRRLGCISDFSTRRFVPRFM